MCSGAVSHVRCLCSSPVILLRVGGVYFVNRGKAPKVVRRFLYMPPSFSWLGSGTLGAAKFLQSGELRDKICGGSLCSMCGPAVGLRCGDIVGAHPYGTSDDVGSLPVGLEFAHGPSICDMLEYHVALREGADPDLLVVCRRDVCCYGGDGLHAMFFEEVQGHLAFCWFVVCHDVEGLHGELT